MNFVFGGPCEMFRLAILNAKLWVSIYNMLNFQSLKIVLGMTI